jgi:chaperonin GroEL
MAKLTGGVAILKVGGATEAEMKERKFRVDDAVHAARAAAQEASSRAAASASLRAGRRDRQARARGRRGAGREVIAKALEAPMATIASNAGYDPSMVVAETREKGGNVGLNAATGEWGDLLEAGVIDAAKVTRTALQNAASVTSLLLTSKTVIVELKENKKKVAGAVK